MDPDHEGSEFNEDIEATYEAMNQNPIYLGDVSPIHPSLALVMSRGSETPAFHFSPSTPVVRAQSRDTVLTSFDQSYGSLGP